MKRIVPRVLFTCSLFALLGACSFEEQDSGLKPRTEAENQAITDSWYPVKSQECQLILDAFGLVTLALGNGNENFVLANSDKVQEQLKITGNVVSKTFLELASNTNEASIRDYVLEAIPLFAKLDNLLPSDSADFDVSLAYLENWASLTGKVPDACKS